MEVEELKAKLKAHYRKHKYGYGVGTGIATFCVIAVVTKGRLGISVSNPIGSDTILIRPISIFSKQIVTVIVADRKGPPSWVIECLEDELRLPSQRAMAHAKGISPSELSAHLNGRLDNVSGLHFKRVGLAA
jgi:hypothetical protein